MPNKKPIKKAVNRRLNTLIKKAGGKKIFNEVRKEANEAQFKDAVNSLEFQKKEKTTYEKNAEAELNFIRFSEKYSQLPANTEKEKAIKKLYAKEIDNYNKRRNREINKIHSTYQKKISELQGAPLKDASPEFKKEIRKLLDAQTEANNKLREVKKYTGSRGRFELKYNNKTDEGTVYKAWQQDEFKNDVLNPLRGITSINGMDVKTDLDKIIDFINKASQRMDSTKVFCVRELKQDGHIKIFFADEEEINEDENEY